MKQTWAFIVVAMLASALFRFTRAEEGSVEEAVFVLTTSNFDEKIKDNELVLVKFYAPWCGHCKRMAPEYEKAAKSMQEKGSKVILGKVDATAETELANKHQINEYPTLLLFRNGSPEKYTGGRTADAIVQWIEKMTGPAVQVIDGDIKEAIEKEATPVAFVGEFKSKDEDLYKTFEKVAEESRQQGKFFAAFAKSNNEIYVLRKEEDKTDFKGKTKEELKKFVDVESFFLLGPINGENYNNYNDRDLEMVWFCGTEKDYDENKAEIRKAAKEFREEYSFAWLDIEHFKGYAENNLRVTEYPGLVYQTKKGARYILQGTPASLKDSAKIVQFLKDVKAGKIDRDIKSEPEPEKNDDPVKIVVGKMFESMVTQADKDVMLEIYAPWCGYCKSFEPIYNEFAEKVKEIEHLVIAKMDGIANDAPLDDFQYNSFPTIYFVKAGEKVPMKFEGARTVEGLMDFVKKNSSKPITIGDKHDEL